MSDLHPFEAPELISTNEVRRSTYIDYRTWGGTKWRAWRHGRSDFRHAPDGDESRAHLDDHIKYLTWSYGRWSAKWDGDIFDHYPADGGPGHGDTVLNYVGWLDRPNIEYWQCYWDITDNMFVHTRYRPSLK